MSDSANNCNQPSLHSPDSKGEPFVPMARSSMLTGRILKSINELGRFDWDVVARMVDEALEEAEIQGYTEGADDATSE